MELFEKLMLVFLLATVDKALVDYFKSIFPELTTLQKQLISIGIGELFAFGMMVDAFALLGFPFKVPFIGIIVTGLLISGGSSLIYDAFDFEDHAKVVMQKEETIADVNERG